MGGSMSKPLVSAPRFTAIGMTSSNLAATVLLAMWARRARPCGRVGRRVRDWHTYTHRRMPRWHMHTYACLHAFLFACLRACLLGCLIVSVCLPDCPSAWRSAFPLACLPVWKWGCPSQPLSSAAWGSLGATHGAGQQLRGVAVAPPSVVPTPQPFVCQVARGVPVCISLVLILLRQREALLRLQIMDMSTL